MLPYQFPPFHKALKEIITQIAIMHVDFAALSLSSQYDFPWMNNTHLFLPLGDEPILVKRNDEKEYQAFGSAYFVGPQLINKTVDLGAQRHVVGITFKPGAIQRLLGIPAHLLINSDLDAVAVFGNEVKEIEMRLRDAKDEAATLQIIEGFLFGIMRKIKEQTPFEQAIDELLKKNGNLTVDTLARYACKTPRQLERQCLDKLGMSPKLFSRLTRFSKVIALKETHPHFTWTRISHSLGYYDQMHLIKDFKMFMGTLPGKSNTDSVISCKMMAALEGCEF